MADNAKPARKPVDWEAIEHIVSTHGPDEKGIERLAVVFCQKPEIWAEMGWAPVLKIMRQVQLGGSRADIVLLHEDGSVSLLEVKRGGLYLRDYCTGIGQLAYQAIMAISVFQTFSVRRVLVAPWPISPDVSVAALVAGVDILPLPSGEEWHSCVTEAVASHNKPVPPPN